MNDPCLEFTTIERVKLAEIQAELLTLRQRCEQLEAENAQLRADNAELQQPAALGWDAAARDDFEARMERAIKAVNEVAGRHGG